MKFINKNWILDLIYPKKCPICGKVRPYGKPLACDKCLELLERVKQPCCMKCGKAIHSEEEEFCEDCRKIPKCYDKGFPVFVYKEPLKKALYDFKYHNQREYATFFAECLYQRYCREWEGLCFDGIVPVPMHKKKRRKRGYNQAALLATELSKKLKIPMYENYLERTEDTNPQKELNDTQRMKNLKNAFKIGQNKIKLERVLLVDDIYTSGATIEACARVLKSSGAERVWYASVAIGKGYVDGSS